jgi:GT2 family glycosyltransferase
MLYLIVGGKMKKGLSILMLISGFACLGSGFGLMYKNESDRQNALTALKTSIVNDYEDDRMVIINHDENMGAGWARRHGIEAATGDYIITIDGDDWISPTFIEDLVNNAKETNADIVSGGITVVYSDEYEEVKKFKPMVSTGFKKFKDYHN